MRGEIAEVDDSPDWSRIAAGDDGGGSGGGCGGDGGGVVSPCGGPTRVSDGGATACSAARPTSRAREAVTADGARYCLQQSHQEAIMKDVRRKNNRTIRTQVRGLGIIASCTRGGQAVDLIRLVSSIETNDSRRSHRS